jgi:hypothetical protein
VQLLQSWARLLLSESKKRSLNVFERNQLCTSTHPLLVLILVTIPLSWLMSMHCRQRLCGMTPSPASESSNHSHSTTFRVVPSLSAQGTQKEGLDFVVLPRAAPPPSSWCFIGCELPPVPHWPVL